MKKINLMAHLVACFPNESLSLEAARALVEGGADILEIQLPFSDPSADGPAIQDACTTVLKNGWRVSDGLAVRWAYLICSTMLATISSARATT